VATDHGRVEAAGRNALELTRVRKDVDCWPLHPVYNGVITDFGLARQMLKQFIRKVYDLRLRPRVILCVPSGSTPAERRAIRDAATGAGASKALWIEAPMAAAIGAGLPVFEPGGSMVVDLGGGTTEIGIISLGGTVYAGSARVGGDDLDDAIHGRIGACNCRGEHLLICKKTAEDIKKKIGCALPGSDVLEMKAFGVTMGMGAPCDFTISSKKIFKALAGPLDRIASSVKSALEKMPPELSADIAGKGMVLTGGGALLRDIDRRLMKETGLPVIVAEDPLTCVARGMGMILERGYELGTEFACEE
jgi:rod shape-determining protein MreB